MSMIALMRNVAKAASAASVKNFDTWWPAPEGDKKEVDRKTWGSKEDAEILKAQIEKIHGIKLG